jgi:type I protein arginine methyltransferase
MCVSPFVKQVDFTSCTLEELKEIDIKFEHKISKTGIIHGYGLYFDAIFRGSMAQNEVVLSTAPSSPSTHWYQTRLLLREPIGVTKGQKLGGTLKMIANTEQSFDGTLVVSIPALNVST